MREVGARRHLDDNLLRSDSDATATLRRNDTERIDELDQGERGRVGGRRRHGSKDVESRDRCTMRKDLRQYGLGDLVSDGPNDHRASRCKRASQRCRLVH